MEEKRPRGRPVTVDIKNHPERKRIYYHNTKVEIMCPCGCLVYKQSLAKHQASKKHVKYIMYNQQLNADEKIDD